MSSLKTVVIVSPESVKSQWCSYESEMTLHLSMDMRRKILIPMVIDDCTIPDHLKPLTYIDARGDAAQWWPKLLLAIQSSAEIPMFESGLPVFSSEPFSFNPHYNNLDTLVKLRSRRRSCIHEEIRSQTIPGALCRKGIQVPHFVFEKQMNILNRSAIYAYHWCWYFIIPLTFCLFTFPMAIGLFAFTVAYGCPTGDRCNSYWIWLEMALGLTFTFVVLICYCFKRRKNEKSLFKIISEINASFLPYQVMLTCKPRFGDYTQSQLRKAMKSSSADHRLQFTSGTISNSQGVLEDDQTPLLDCPSEYAFTSSIQKNENDRLEQISKDILLRHSAKYLRLFLDEKLPRPEPPRHTTQVVCLCQYVENIERFQSSTDQSSNIIEV